MKELTRRICGTLLIGALASFGCGGDDGDGGGGSGDPPAASFTFTPDCTMSSSDAVTFTSTATDPEDGSDLDCSWTFASGTPSSSVECEVSGVTFPNRNPYAVTLIVTDSDGNTDSVQESVAPCN